MANFVMTSGFQHEYSVMLKSQSRLTGVHCAKYRIAHKNIKVFMLTIIHQTKTFCHVCVTVRRSVIAKLVLEREQPMIMMNSPT